MNFCGQHNVLIPRPAFASIVFTIDYRLTSCTVTVKPLNKGHFGNNINSAVVSL